MKYTHLIFDADETLFDFKKSERKALERSLADFDIIYDATYHLPLYKSINSLLWEQLEEGLISQDDIKVKRFIAYKSALKADFDPESFALLFIKYLGEGSYLLQGAENLIKSIAPHYKLHILTNGLTAVQKNRLSRAVIADYFEHQFISEEIGCAKPNIKIFEHVFNQIEHKPSPLDPSSYLMIGDSLSSDIQGANNAGIDSCWLNLHKKVNSSTALPTYEVDSLEALKRFLLDNDVS